MILIRTVLTFASMVTAVAITAVFTVVSNGPVELVVFRIDGVAIGLYVDALSALLLAFVGSVCALVAWYSTRNLAGQSRTGRFGGLLLMALSALVLLVAGASLPLMAVGWTVSGWVLASLVAQTGTSNARRASAFVRRRLLIGDAAVWAATGVAVAALPSVNRPQFGASAADSVTITIIVSLLLVGCVVRSALVPAQSWLPETAEAPSPVSAFLHAGIVNGAGVMVCLTWPLFRRVPAVLLALVVVGAASVVFGTVASRMRHDVKGRLACSTTTQMGYMTVQLGLGLPAAAVLHVIGHGYYKAWLFLRAGGAVSRARWETAPSVASSTRQSMSWAGRAYLVLIGVLGAVVLWPLTSASIDVFGTTAVVPTVVALCAIAVGTSTVLRTPRTSVFARLAVPAAATASAFLYLVTFRGLEKFLSSSLPHAKVWGQLMGAGLVVALVAAGLGTVLLVRAVAARPDSWVAIRLSGSALSPWTRKFTGTAAWPDESQPGPTDVETPDARTMHELVDCASVIAAPVWPLRTAVAANPLANLESFSFGDAADVASAALGTSGYLPPSEYRRLHESGRITRDHLRTAIVQHEGDRGRPLPPLLGLDSHVDGLLAALDGSVPAGRDQVALMRRFTELVERPGRGAVSLTEIADAHVNLWCQRAWSRALDDSSSPWALWLTAASRPSYGRTTGLVGISDRLKQLPDESMDALAWMLARSPVATADYPAYLTALLASSPGWASHAAWRARMLEDNRPLADLLAIRAAVDLLATGGLAPSVRSAPNPPGSTVERPWVVQRQLWQSAYEVGYRAPLIEQLRHSAMDMVKKERVPAGARPKAQLIFCIDVRSERLRRAIEACGHYATLGFAGFFGVVVNYRTPEGATFELCPALVRPTALVTGTTDHLDGLRKSTGDAVLKVSGAPITPLVVAEAGGALSGLASLIQTAAPSWWRKLDRSWKSEAGRWGPAQLRTKVDDEHSTDSAPELSGSTTLSSSERESIALQTLRSLGLVDNFASLLVVVGHGASMENNAFAAAYDCGACGGNSGHINARLLAEILNDTDVRAALVVHGITIPSSTMAIAAIHDTTTDDVIVDPWRDPLQQPETVEDLRASLAVASGMVRSERAVTLPGAPRHQADPDALARHIRARAADWAQAFPEFGLAGNAAFVIGPRALTAGLDLQGRVFLHEYDADLDSDHSILESILNAPAVVTQWISAQYYASTVDHEIFGAGDKATHNVVGDVGVLTGAHGDLRVGLPWQALFTADPRRARDTAQHEPLRHLVVVLAKPSTISPIVLRSSTLHTLLGNEWMTLVAIDPETGEPHRLDRSLDWKPWSDTYSASWGLDPDTIDTLRSEHQQ